MRSTVLGQDRALDMIQRALTSGRLHHAWLFCGPPGVGKCTTAIALAKVLLNGDLGAEDRAALRVDPASPVVRRMDAGTHADYHLIVKELALHSSNPDLRNRKLTNIPLDLLRERMLGGTTSDKRTHEAAAYRTASEQCGKVFIIDEAELVDHTAQNALLKTLEEPPPETYIFLVTSSPERLLPTVLSRCQMVRFGPLNDASMQQWIRQSNIALPEADAEWIVNFAEGSPGTAQLVVEYGIHGWQQTLRSALQGLPSGQYDPDMGSTMSTLIDDFSQAWVKKQPQASKLAANRLGARLLFQLLTHDARRRLAEACANGSDPTFCLEMIDRVQEAEYQMIRNVNVKHVLENLSAQCAVVSL